MAYPFQLIEQHWQTYWQTHQTFKTPDISDKPKYYILDMFPYPSGAGLHVGHPEGYTATDIIARYKRMKGMNVLHPMGWDAFGLPTERYSMKTGIHPAKATEDNVNNFRRQMQSIGFSYDWSREINTTHPDYYKWTQSIFLTIYNSWYDHAQEKARPIEELPIPADYTDTLSIETYKDSKRLAFVTEIPVWWCEDLGTVLANEEVEEWKSKGHTVVRKPMRQWMLRITEYAERLLADLDLISWPQSTLEMQKNWIGKSIGAEVDFAVVGHSAMIRVFTTRPDTIFGVSYLVLAPDHPFVDQLTTPDQRHIVQEYQLQAIAKSDLERTELTKDKTGVWTGAYAINPANGEKVPVWIADYVLSNYGTGSVMGVPSGDVRDHAFASKYHLPIPPVVTPADGSVWDTQVQAFDDYAHGIAINSANDHISLNGIASNTAKSMMTDWLAEQGYGTKKVQYKLRDWLFSRQRYWGEPVPIIFFDDGTKRVLDLDELPLTLPDVQDFQPAGTGESPLAKVESWVSFIDKKTGKQARYETNTMPQWAGSCWYYLRFIDPHNQSNIFSPSSEQYWMGTNPDQGGIDLYVGGAEHAVLHLLYARFWHKVLFDYGIVSTKEPFAKLFHQGLILGEDGQKMSKSLGNVVNPDDVIREYGADSLRIFEMFMGPLEMAKPWSTKGVEGVHRFLNRVWRMIADEEGTLLSDVQDIPLTKEQEFVLHSTIKKVSEDIDTMSFNTSVSQMMIFVNEFTKTSPRPRTAMEQFVLVLSPFAPHVAEELWKILGHTKTLAYEPFPAFDPAKLVQDDIEIVIQVSSKVRAKLVVPMNADEASVVAQAMTLPDIIKHIEGKTIKKQIYVPNKLLNVIVA